jgi:hypothetical protein
MGRPQLGFPRLRFAVGRATGIAIRPDHNSTMGGCAAEPCEVRANRFALSVFNWRNIPVIPIDGVLSAIDFINARLSSVWRLRRHGMKPLATFANVGCTPS